MTNKLSIGSQAREVRLQRKLTLDQLSSATGLSKGHLSRFERGHKTLSISSLVRLAEALDTSVSSILGERSANGKFHLVRNGEGTTRSVAMSEARYRYTSLSRSGDGPFSAFVLELSENEERAGSVSHSGEEAVYVLSGKIEMELDGERFLLAGGDYIQFSGEVEHQMRSVEGTSRIYMVVVH